MNPKVGWFFSRRVAWFARIPIAILVLGATVADPTRTVGAVLNGSFSTLPAGANVNLTPEGSIDWAHWGLTAPEDFNHKAGIASQITDLVVIGEAVIEQFGDNATGYTWADGDPTLEADNATAGIYVVGQDNGFQFSVPADTTARTLKVYVGAYNAGMTFEASLSDSSAPAYSETRFRNVEDGPNAVFTLNYSASMANQTLVVRFIVGEFIGGFGNVTLQAATLGPAAPAIELVRPTSDALFYPATNGLAFRARTLAPRALATNQIRLFLNDNDVSTSLNVTGTPTEREAALATLNANTLYRAQIVVTDDSGRSSTNSFSFDTFDPNMAIVIEAEDFNYSDGVCTDAILDPAPTIGGLYQDQPPASGYDTNGVQVGGLQPDGSRRGYVGAAGLPGVDFNDTAEFPIGVDAYRPCDPVVTGDDNAFFSDTAPDLFRSRLVAAGVRDFVAAGWQAGEWLNYTRTFGGRYRAYLRAATTGDGQLIQLDRVTSDRSQPNQTIEAIGQFSMTRSGLLLGLRTLPLLDVNSAPIVVELSGLQTLRLTAPDAANNVSVNYLVLVPDSPRQPAPPTLSVPALSAGSISFSFPTESGFTYTVEFREALAAGEWQRLTPTVAGDGTTQSFSRPMSTPGGFFRVAVQ